MLAGLGAGLLEVTLGAAFVCVDSCPPRDFYFSYLGPGTVHAMTPCVVLEALAVAAFLAYCLATRQARRVVMALLILLVGGLGGAAALIALAQHAQATLPSAPVSEGGILFEAPLEAWANEWGLALAPVAGAWSGTLAYLEWRR